MGNLIQLYYAAANKIEKSLFKAIVQKLDFIKEQFNMEIQYFSDGQKSSDCKKLMSAFASAGLG